MNSQEFHQLGKPLTLSPPAVDLVVADQESRLRADGAVEMELVIGNHKFKWPVYVAQIGDDFLLGSDILDAQDIVVSSRRGLQVRGVWVPCEVARRPVHNRRASVVMPHDVDIPPSHETILHVRQSCEQITGCAVLEPLFEDNRELMIGRSLVDLGSEVVPVRVVNLSDKPQRLRKGHLLGELQPVETVAEMAPTVTVRVVGCHSSSNAAIESSSPAAEEEFQEDEELPTEEALQKEALELPEHVRGLYTSTAAEVLASSIRTRLRDLLTTRQGAFARNKLDLGCFTEIEHEINTGCAAPVRERLRPTPRGFEAEEKQCLEEQLEAGVIRPSSSAWAAATVLVRKSDGSVRYCVDYRKLNDRSQKDAYPLPQISMCLDSLSGAHYFTTLDLQSGYWQIGMEQSSIPKTAFITKYGLFEYTRMPFGLCVAPSTFERCMELVLRGLQWETLLIYLDDVIIHGETMTENLDRLEEVLLRLEGANLRLKPSKCHLIKPEVLFLGHIVSGAGVRPNPKLIEAVENWPVPKTRKEVMQFMGLCNYYRKFIASFSAIAAPLTELTSKTKEFLWGEEAQTAYLRLKEVLCKAPILAFPQDGGNFVLDTDASGSGVGAVLQQIQDGKEKVIAYGSKKLSKEQRRYCVTRRELLAIVVFLKEFRRYLLGHPFLIRTDHNSLTWLLNFKEPQGQLARFLEYISEYNFQIQHREGKKHGNADSLSRSGAPEPSCDEYRAGVPLASLPCGGCRYCRKCHEEWAEFSASVDDVIPLGNRCRQVKTRSQTGQASGATTEGTSHGKNAGKDSATSAATERKVATWAFGLAAETLREAQEADSVLWSVHDWMKIGSRPSREEAASLSPAERCYWLNWDSIVVIEGILYYRWERTGPRDTTKFKLLVPARYKADILRHSHDTLFAAHLGLRKTFERVRQRFHWYGMRSDVKQHIALCDTCQRSKAAHRKHRAALKDYRVGAPLDRVAVDVMGPLPVTAQGNKYLIVVCDYFTRWVEAFPLPDQKADRVAQTFVHEFVCRFGAPLEVHSDQGRNFESTLFQEVCRLLHIAKTRTTALHPSSNGLVENFNGTLASMIRSSLCSHAGDWDLHIPILTAAYRSTVHTATGFTPNFLMLGRETTTPVDIVFPRVGSGQDLPEYVESLQARFAECYSLARSHLKAAAEQQRKFHDTRVSQRMYKVGDAVLKQVHRTTKFGLSWLGPFLVKQVINDALYEITDKKKSGVIHHDRLKPFLGELPRWAKKAKEELRRRVAC